jgi:hypothetical protein
VQLEFLALFRARPTRSAKVGEERYVTVLAKHNALIEHLIEALNGTRGGRAQYETQRMCQEEDNAIDAFLAWHDQRDLPPDAPTKDAAYRGRMENLVRFLQSAWDMSSEYGALDDEGKRALRARMRAMVYEPWPIKGD